MTQPKADPMISLKTRFLSLFLAMYKQRGWLYTQGYFLGWLAHLARYDLSITQRLRNLEHKYGIEKD